ncbi:hypothetical protein CO230_02510 [Chryseobacterium sp. 6424]|nr:hypothetical protein CO230_02510 [Chryseobacterium sp. 6424]
MISKSLLYVLSIIGFTACQNQNSLVQQIDSGVHQHTPAIPDMSAGLPPEPEATRKTEKGKKEQNIIYLKEGETKFLKEQQMNITFKGITEDSRCPQGVNCVWAGTALAQIVVMGVYTRPYTILLSTLADTKKGYNTSRNFNGYEFSLAEVNPQPTTNKDYKDHKGNYRIGLNITRKSAGSDHQTTKR